jgi:hypothetical protein
MARMCTTNLTASMQTKDIAKQPPKQTWRLSQLYRWSTALIVELYTSPASSQLLNISASRPKSSTLLPASSNSDILRYFTVFFSWSSSQHRHRYKCDTPNTASLLSSFSFMPIIRRRRSVVTAICENIESCQPPLKAFFTELVPWAPNLYRLASL